MNHPERVRSFVISASVVVLTVSAIFILAGWSGAGEIFGQTTADQGRRAPVMSVPPFPQSSCTASGAPVSRTVVPSGLSDKLTADNTDAIQDAIDNAYEAGGGTVVLPAGTFLIDGHLELKSNVKLVGAGSATVIKAGPGFLDTTGPQGGYPLITTSGARNITIANLVADQSGNQLNAAAYGNVRLIAYLIDVRDSYNAVVDGVSTRNPFSYSIAVVGSSNFCVEHSKTRVTTSGLYYGLDGVHILDSHNGQVIDNHIDQRIGTDGDDGLAAQSMTAPVYNVLFAGNTVRGGNDGDGMQLAVGNYPIYNLVIQGNNFWGSPYGIRTGYWATGRNGTVHNITVRDNYIHDLKPGKAFPKGGNAVDIGGFGAVAPVFYIKVTGNAVCQAGTIILTPGTANTMAGNKFCA